MLQARKFLLLITAIIMVWHSNLWAQAGQGSDEALGDSSYAKSIRSLKEGAGGALQENQLSGVPFSGIRIPPFATGNTPCLKSDGEGEEESCMVEEKMVVMQPGERKKGFYALVPGRGLNDIMDSEGIVDQRSELMESKNALLNITWNMVEPAVAAGMHNAMVQSEQSLHSRYLAEANYIKQLSLFPHMQKVVLDGYFECFGNKMNDSGGGGDEAKWIEAMHFCMADSLEKSSGNSDGFSDAGEGFQMADSRNHPKTRAKDGTGAGSKAASQSDRADEVCKEDIDKNAVCLTHWLVKQEEIQDKEEFIKHYHKYIGDVVFEVPEAEDATPGFRILSYRLLKFTKDEGGPEVVYGKLIESRYKSLLNTMKEYCEWIKKAGGGGASGWQSAFTHDPEFKDGSQDFWIEKKGEDFWVDMSVPGFGFTPALGDALFEMFKRNSDVEEKNMECKFLDPGEEENTPKKYGTKDPASSEKLRDFHRLYYWYAQTIAEADLLMVYGRTIRWLSRLSSGASQGSDPLMYNVAMDQIHSLLGVDDIDGRYYEVIEDLIRTREHIYKVRTSEIGNAAGVLSNLRAGTPQQTGGAHDAFQGE